MKDSHSKETSGIFCPINFVVFLHLTEGQTQRKKERHINIRLNKKRKIFTVIFYIEKLKKKIKYSMRILIFLHDL